MDLSKKVTKNIPAPTNFGKNLKFLRRLKGLSQTELAKKVEMKRNNIASYESGVVEPKMTKFLDVCRFFDVDPREMLSTDLTDKPIPVFDSDIEKEPILKKYMNEQMDEFISQTNEITKVYEGYKVYYGMLKEKDRNDEHAELYGTIDDLLNILAELVKSNWHMIQNVLGQEGQES